MESETTQHCLCLALAVLLVLYWKMERKRGVVEMEVDDGLGLRG